VDGVKIPMTAPVRAVVDAGAGPACESNFTVGFYSPQARARAPRGAAPCRRRGSALPPTPQRPAAAARFPFAAAPHPLTSSAALPHSTRRCARLTQEAPPAPTSPDIVIRQEAAACVWVGQFGGFPNEAKFLEKAAAMLSELAAAGEAVATGGRFATAAYDPPTRLWGRTNEVWLSTAGGR